MKSQIHIVTKYEIKVVLCSLYVGITFNIPRCNYTNASYSCFLFYVCFKVSLVTVHKHLEFSRQLWVYGIFKFC